MPSIGRFLVVAGLVLAAIGVVLLFAGRLPGDLTIRRGSLTVYLPIATGLVVSVVLTIVLNLLMRR